MKNHRFDRYIYTGITAILVIIAAILVLFSFVERKAIGQAVDTVISVLSPLIIGAILTFLMSPVYNFVYDHSRKLLTALKMKSEKATEGISKTSATLVSLIFLIIIVFSLLSLIIPQLYSSIIGIVNALPTYFQNIYDALTSILEDNPDLESVILPIYEQVVQSSQEWAADHLIPQLQSLGNLNNLKNIIGGVSSGVMGIINILKNSLIGIIAMIYMLNIKTKLKAKAKKIIYALVPLKYANETVNEFRYIHKVFSGFIIGKLIDSLIIGILCFILMTIFKMPLVLLVSVIIGVTNVIPFFGPFIGAIPTAILIFLVSPKSCLWFILLILLLQQFDGNFLGPKILGNSTGLDSFWVLASILLFGGLWGFAGMIIAVPLTAVIFDLFDKLQYVLLRKKNLSPDSRDYEALMRIDEKDGTFINKDN